MPSNVSVVQGWTASFLFVYIVLFSLILWGAIENENYMNFVRVARQKFD